MNGSIIRRSEPVFVLCGGRGRRMGEMSASLPKPLSEICGKPMLDHILDLLRAQGFCRFVFGTGHLSSKIEAHIESRREPGVEMIVSNAGEDASILQRIYAALPHFGNETVVCYGDTFIDISFERVLESHRRSKAAVTILTSAIRNPFGIVSFDSATGKVQSFVEKPVFQYYIGGLIWSRAASEYIDDQLLAMPDGGGLIALFERLIAESRLHAYPHDGMQITFNTEPEKQDAEQALRSYYTVRER